MKPALLVIDVQVGIFAENPDRPQELIRTIQECLQAARQHGALVVHVQHNDEDLVRGTPNWQIHPELAPRAEERVFDKQVSSAFRDTELEVWLRSHRVDTVVIVGMQTEFCMDASIKSAFERHFRVWVPESGHSTCDAAVQSASAIKDWYAGRIWNGRFATVAPLAQILTLWSSAEPKEERPQ